MAKIFRLHSAGNNTISDWQKTSKYGTNVINQINDPNGNSAQKEITSIPSPFARMDLVKTAFEKVNDLGVDGITIHHKMVSDALDVGQILFEFNKFQNDFEIITWNKQNDIDALLNSNNPGHQLLGKTLDIFIQQDGSVYNLDKTNNIYLLNYKKGNQLLNIIGATSPASLFFSSANDLSYITPNIQFGNNDRPFDSQYAPLYKREFEFQKFLHTLRMAPNFSSLFSEVDKYIIENFKLLGQNDQNIIKNLDFNNYTNDFQDIPIGGNAGNIIYILNNLPMKQKIYQTVNIEKNSGFLIKSEYKINNQTPLVLPVDKYTKQTFYASGNWDPNTKVPYFDPVTISKRVLPDDGTQYPYITISDFLNDSIVEMPYDIDSNNFFDGNYNENNGKSYLLPLSDLFFDFFTSDDVRNLTMHDGKKMFETISNASGVTVFLRIPVSQGYVEYKRIYFESLSPTQTRITNDGAVIKKNFGLGVLPLVHYPEDVAKHYRIALFDKGEHRLNLSFKLKNKIVNVDDSIIRNEKDLINNICGSESYVVEDSFDRIELTVGAIAKGYLIPLFKKTTGSTEFTFAVDFGTTNTHIEYANSSNPNPIPFNVRHNEKQINKLHKTYDADPDIRLGFDHDFIPETIGERDDIHSFPMRTVFSYHKNNDFNRNLLALAHGNIPFLYGKNEMLKYNETKTNLKWGSEGKDQKLLEMHIKTLFILMRNKVALNGGDLKNTKIIWFYPASMTKGRIDRFTKVWLESYRDYFGDQTDNVISISESTAPYNYYIKKKGAYANIATIDVGGGTTDVYITENNEPKMLQSFRFASDAIFGDGYNSDSDLNGFVKTYLEKFQSILLGDDLRELERALNQIEMQKKSSDIVAFLFSLTGDKVKNNPSLDFLKMLTDNDQFRYVFIIFYSSIFYFIAKTMKAKGLKRPLTIAFSGNGSHSLKVVSTSDDTVAKFAELIFNKVYSDGEYKKINIIMEDEPKKATCKGGILAPDSQNYEGIKEIKYVHLGNNLDECSGADVVYSDVDNEKIKGDVIRSVKDFFTFLFDMDKEADGFFKEYLSADPKIYSSIRDICFDETLLEQSLNFGLNIKKSEENGNIGQTKVEETLFFYPLVGVLHKLAFEIASLNK